MLFFVMACQTLDSLLCWCLDRVLAVVSRAIEIGARSSPSGRTRIPPQVALTFQQDRADADCLPRLR